MSKKEQKEAPQRRQAPQTEKARKETKEFARVTYVFVGLFLVMMGYLCYFNVVKSRDMI